MLLLGVLDGRVTIDMPATNGGGIAVRAFADENEIQLHTGANHRRRFLAFQPRTRLPQQLAVEFEPDADNVSALFRSQQITCTTQLEIAHCDSESSAELVVLSHGREPLPRHLQQARVPVEQEIGVGLMLEPANAP